MESNKLNAIKKQKNPNKKSTNKVTKVTDENTPVKKSTKITHKILTKRGYVINKSQITPEQLQATMAELNVTPIANSDFGEETVSFPLFKNTSTQLCIPRYYGVEKFGQPLKTIGMVGGKSKFKFKGSMKSHQVPIVDTALKTLKDKGGGILQLYCGCGKTVLALKIAAELGLKTLIVVHKSFLQNQWYDRIKEFTDAKVGLIRQKKVDVEGKDIVVGMLQSIAMINYDLEIFNDFQLIICDEVHHFASRVFSQALYKIGSKYTLGLSATPNRSDGLTKVLYWYLGNIMYKLERAGDKRVFVKVFNYTTEDPNYKEKKTWVKGKGMKANPPKMITSLQKVSQRNKFIVNILKTVMVQDERKILVLSDRIDHLMDMKKLLDSEIAKLVFTEDIEEGEITTAYYIGKMKEYERVDAVKADIIFATYAMAAEGLDIPTLNTLLFATPKKNVIQCVGRILRKQVKEGDVSPLVIDILDHYSVFESQGNKRVQYYSSKKYTIEHYNGIDDKIVTKAEYVKKLYGNDYYELHADDENWKDYDPDPNKIMYINPDLFINDDVVDDEENENDENDEDDYEEEYKKDKPAKFNLQECMFSD